MFRRSRIALFLAALLFSGADAPAVAHAHVCGKPWPSERLLAREINQLRNERGKTRLPFDPQLWRVARMHSREMANRGALFHTTAEDFAVRVTNWSVIGENIGAIAASKEEMTFAVRELLRAFRASPPHRRILLGGQWNHSGIGIVWRNDTMWATVLVSAGGNPGTTLRMPTCP